MHIIAIHKPPKMQIFSFISILKKILQKITTSCPTIVIGDFNINMLIKNTYQ